MLYYYDINDASVGGNIEFLGSRPMAARGGDTCMPSGFQPDASKKLFFRQVHPRTRVNRPSQNMHIPIFLNYQMATEISFYTFDSASARFEKQYDISFHSFSWLYFRDFHIRIQDVTSVYVQHNTRDLVVALFVDTMNDRKAIIDTDFD